MYSEMQTKSVVQTTTKGKQKVNLKVQKQVPILPRLKPENSALIKREQPLLYTAQRSDFSKFKFSLRLHRKLDYRYFRNRGLRLRKVEEICPSSVSVMAEITCFGKSAGVNSIQQLSKLQSHSPVCSNCERIT